VSVKAHPPGPPPEPDPFAGWLEEDDQLSPVSVRTCRNCGRRAAPGSRFCVDCNERDQVGAPDVLLDPVG
jgi:hypothetical protein